MKKKSKSKKIKVTDDASFEGCPTSHFLTKLDRVRKFGTTTWKFTPEQFLGIRARHVHDAGYDIQKAIQ